MNLADMLTYADIGQLTHIASYYQCDCKRNSKHELIQSILVKIGGKDFFEEMVRSLTEADLRFLNHLAFDSRSGYSLEDLTAVIRHTFGEDGPTKKEKGKALRLENPREAVARYRKSGWLFNGFTQSTRYTFHVPTDLKHRFREVLRVRLADSIRPAGDPSVYRDEQGLLVEDAAAFLKYVRHHEVELNAEGFMYRRTQQQLLATLYVAEPLVNKGAWRFGYGRASSEYPDRFALLYDYAYAKQWIREDGYRLVLTDRGAEMLTEGTAFSVIQIFRFWLRLYKGAVPNLSSIVYWIGQSSRNWITMTSLQESLSWLIRPFYYDTSDIILEQRVVRMLMHFGMLRIGEGEEGTVVRMTALGLKAAEACLHIGNSDDLAD